VGPVLVRIGAVDAAEFDRRNDEFFAQYQAGTLDPVEYLEFSLGTLASFPREAGRDAGPVHGRSGPAGDPPARALLQKHLDAGDLVAIVTATNHFVTAPIAKALGVEHLIAAMPEVDAEGNLTGKLLGTPTQGAGKSSTPRPGWKKWARSWRTSSTSHFYSDSHNDLPLMSIVSHPVATNPNEN
jgi:phosphoserine phosphatase